MMLTKLVDGKRIPLSAEEVTAREAEEAANTSKPSADPIPAIHDLLEVLYARDATLRDDVMRIARERIN